MTFPEAGIQILERAGRPLHFQEIAAQAIQQGLLSHVGQIPESTMRERLLALAKRSTERRLTVVGEGQFALTDWGLPEDAQALAGLEHGDEPPEEPALRSKERHPSISLSKSAGRGESPREAQPSRKLKKHRLPPLSAVAGQLLAEAGTPLELAELLIRGREKALMSEDLAAETLLNSLQEENRRRSKAGRSPAFEVNGVVISLLSTEVLEVAELEPSHTLPSGDLGLERPPPAAAGSALESRRQAARQLRRRVQELSRPALERLVQTLLTKSGYREIQPIKLRSVEGEGLGDGIEEGLFIARRKLGLSELRFLCKVLPAGSEVTRELVEALREGLVEAEAHAGLVIGPGEATVQARASSQLLGAPLLTLLCSDAFVEELVLRQVGVLVYEHTAVDEAFWRTSPRPTPAEPRARPPRREQPRAERGANGRGGESRAKSGPVVPSQPVLDAPAGEPEAQTEGEQPALMDAFLEHASPPQRRDDAPPAEAVPIASQSESESPAEPLSDQADVSHEPSGDTH